MLNINNGASKIKREILVRIAKLQLEGNLEEGVHYIPREMAPRNSESFRCCVYHDREVLRLRVMARLGHSVEDYDDEKKLSEFAREALEREKPTEPMLTVLDDACNACVRAHYMVTNACQACVARPCMMNCPKNCIAITGGRAHIDPEACVNCGICMQNCPYHAIIRIPVPCEEACPVGAISKDENGKERIDYSKCTFCGACMRECPFGAMMDKGQIVDVIRKIMEGKKVVALYAPAIAAQFRAVPGQLEAALLKAGFSKTFEVAHGADITADKEAEEFEERMERGDALMTTSCCPAYVRAVRIHAPDLNPCVSETRSPMHYTAEMAKKEDSGYVTVFIGPCLAKRKEGLDDPYVDYVLSAEELGALFMAKEIDLGSCEPLSCSSGPTASGRNFAQSGGVAEAVRIRLKHPERLKPFVINGLDAAGMKQLKAFGKAAAEGKSAEANLVEVMACPGGCIAGPSVITNPKVAAVQLKKYVSTGK
ncbi:MAG TPA: monomeric [FeFe] hydrogenase [Treponemataceae bacterium]|jgi:[FeFe] hydrogenase (group B1/B3)|nr:MAG: Iron hydrogenase 1 [Spirochaetes bacterium ADurb.Bin269]HOC28523.1 monomeric [FeFe] hydrogenase [Treponemataceae bacterium]HPX46565.1 monomeric [FeFe] hydrogenase [Treponemataceae bacterium]HQL31654.1 monomeric [FeFe] hydrogenase [Treponemataceae bacterium]